MTHDHNGSATGSEVFLRRVDTERLIKARGDVIGRDWIVLGTRSSFIACANDLAGPHAATGEKAEHRSWIVVATSLGCPTVDLRCASELTCDEDACGVQ